MVHSKSWSWLVGVTTILSILYVYRLLTVIRQLPADGLSLSVQNQHTRTARMNRYRHSGLVPSSLGGTPESTKRMVRSTWTADVASPKFELTALVLFRVNFTNDLLHFTNHEIDQWMTYLEYAGVQHFYLYDNCQNPTECVGHLYRNDPRVTYVHWPVRDYVQAQDPAYEHHRVTHPKSKYEFCADIDEYPFMPNDLEPNFLLRYARQMTVGQMLIRTWFYGGPKPEMRTRDHPWRVMRYLHKQMEPEKVGRFKPLYVSSEVSTIRVHRAEGPALSTQTADPDVIYIKHYWCERLEKPLPVYDDSIAPLIDKIMAYRGTQESGLRLSAPA